jgi:hypothetical protein
VTTEVLAQALTGGVQATFGQGRVWYIKTANAALTIIAEKKGSSASVRRFINVGAGFKFTADQGDGWDYLRVTSAVSQNIEIVLSDDDVEVANAVSVTGSVSVVAQPSSSVSTPAALAVGTGSAGAIAANLSRKRITIANDSGNGAKVYIQSTGAGTGRGVPLADGLFAEFDTTAALDVRNDSGLAATITTFEET